MINGRKLDVKFGQYGGPINPQETNAAFTVLSSYRLGYPETTGYHCWWCTYPFDTPPIGVPKRTSLTGDTFYVIGNFCSFACSLAYAQDDRSLKITTGDLINMYHKMTNKRDINYTDRKLKPAPSRYILEKFGGRLSIEEYRALSHESKSVLALTLPQIPMNMFVETASTDISDLCIRMANLTKPVKLKASTRASASNGGKGNGAIGKFVDVM